MVTMKKQMVATAGDKSQCHYFEFQIQGESDKWYRQRSSPVFDPADVGDEVRVLREFKVEIAKQRATESSLRWIVPAEFCRDSLPYRYCKISRTREVLDETLSAS